MDAPIDRDPMMLLAELSAPVQWAVLAVAVLGTAIVLFKPKFLRRDPLTRTPQNASLAQQRSVERQMQNLLVELSEMSRQVTSTLDTRATKLDLLIREADEKIAVLTELLAKADQIGASSFQTDGSARHPTPQQSTPEFSTPVESIPRPLMTERSMLLPPPDSAGASFRHGDPAQAVKTLAVASSSGPSPYDADARHAEVYLLADQGQSPSEIAAQLHRPCGEVQLILALRPDRRPG